MRTLFCGAIALLLLAPQEVRGQSIGIPDQWLGTWELNVQQSRFDDRAPLMLLGQTLSIEAGNGLLALRSDSVLQGGRHVPEVVELRLDGKDTILPSGLAVSYKRIDQTAFDIVVTVNNQALGNGLGVNQFVFTPDGKRLTETKSMSQRAYVSDGPDRSTGALVRTATSILVFDRTRQ